MFKLLLAFLVSALLSLGVTLPGIFAPADQADTAVVSLEDEVRIDNSAKAQFEFDIPQTEDEPFPPGDDEPRFEMAELGP